MATKKKTAEAEAPKKVRGPHVNMYLKLDEKQKERFEAMASDYDLKIGEARDKAGELLDALLDSLEEVLRAERREKAQMEISELERLIEEKRAELEGTPKRGEFE